MDKRKTFKFKGYDLYLDVATYLNNGRIYIGARDKDEPYGDVTINLTDTFINDDECFINSYTKSGGLEDKLIKLGVIKKIIRPMKYNMGTYDWVQLDLDKLKEYDPKGVDKYLNPVDEDIDLKI